MLIRLRLALVYMELRILICRSAFSELLIRSKYYTGSIRCKFDC